MARICFDVDKFREFIKEAFNNVDIFLDFNKFKVYEYILEGRIIGDKKEGMLWKQRLSLIKMEHRWST